MHQTLLKITQKKVINMKLLSDVSLSESDVNSQLKVNQTLAKINTLMDVADGLKEWEGVQRIEIFLRIETKLIDLIDEL
jgi:hypothetical protein